MFKRASVASLIFLTAFALDLHSQQRQTTSPPQNAPAPRAPGGPQDNGGPIVIMETGGSLTA